MNKILNIFWKNAFYKYDNWGLTGWGWLAVISLMILMMILMMICFFHKWGIRLEIKKQDQYKEIKSLGYDDIDDIEVFLGKIDANLEDFILSQGIRKQYELFREGLSSDFIKTAEANKKAKEIKQAAENAGINAGIVTGIIMSNQNK